MKMIWYKMWDGKEIEGYVILLLGVLKENKVFFVVLLYGGFWVWDNWGWDVEV